MTVDAVALEISNNAILTSNIIVRNSTTFVERVMTFRGRDYNGITKSVDESSGVNRTHLLNRFHQTIFNIHCKPPYTYLGYIDYPRGTYRVVTRLLQYVP